MRTTTLKCTADKMASLCFLGADYEPTPEPWRGQSDITIVLPYSEYCKFIRDYLSVQNYLLTGTFQLRNYLFLSATQKLCSAYMLDMAAAVCKELHYCERRRIPATRIIHYIDDTNVKTVPTADVHIGNADTIMRAFMASKGYPISSNFVEGNLELYNYALRLYASATSGNFWNTEVSI